MEALDKLWFILCGLGWNVELNENEMFYEKMYVFYWWVKMNLGWKWHYEKDLRVEKKLVLKPVYEIILDFKTSLVVKLNQNWFNVKTYEGKKQ